ncbi:MAG: LON peptidase substrate-binding domain-containing protein, partial [Desulfobacteraceae bacterium]
MTEKKPSVDYNSENLPKTLPILPLYDAALFPKMVLPLVVMESDSLTLVDEAMAKDRIIGLVVSQKQTNVKSSTNGDLARVGCSALILKMAKTENDKAQMLVQGLTRFKIESFIKGGSYLRAKVTHFDDIENETDETRALIANIVKQFGRIVELSPGLPEEIGQMASSIKEAGTLADMIASTINSSSEEKQKVLEIKDSNQRLKQVTKLVNHQLSIL